MRHIVEAACIPWNEVKLAFNNPSIAAEWEEITSTNRDFLYERGFWGVPCIKYQDQIVWGQDKIYHISDLIKQQ
jgi:2-hydroxychromene-2-carboxylate isomerase